MEDAEGVLDFLVVAAEVEDLEKRSAASLAEEVVGVQGLHRDGEGEPALCWGVQGERTLFANLQLLESWGAVEVEGAPERQGSNQTQRDCGLEDSAQMTAHICLHLQ